MKGGSEFERHREALRRWRKLLAAEDAAGIHPGDMLALGRLPDRVTLGSEPEQRFAIWSTVRHGLVGGKPPALQVYPERGVMAPRPRLYHPDAQIGEGSFVEIKATARARSRRCSGCAACWDAAKMVPLAELSKPMIRKIVARRRCDDNGVLWSPSEPSYFFCRGRRGGGVTVGSDKDSQRHLETASLLWPEYTFWLCWEAAPHEGRNATASKSSWWAVKVTPKGKEERTLWI